MALNKSEWQIIVHARTNQARSSMMRLAQTAQSAQGAFDKLQAASFGVTQEIKSTPRVFDEMTRQIKSGKMNYEQFMQSVRARKGIVARQNQLQNAMVTSFADTDGAVSSTMATMKKFSQSSGNMIQHIALGNTALRALSTNIVDMGKNMQWAGRQITVGFTVPFGIAMLGASAAFLDFEEQVIRFRKVFNEELGATTEEAEERVVGLANTMATELGVVRNDVLETAATFAQMGKGVEEVEALTRATTRLALLGEVPRETATSLLRSYEASGFDEMAGGLENVVNHLNAIENSTSLTVNAMAQALPQIIPIFEQVNLSFGEGEALVAGMVQSLGNASEAVNALKVGMQRVYDPTREAIDAFDRIGIDLLAIRDRNATDVIGFFGELGTVMETAIENNSEFADTIGNLFGVRQGGRLATALRAVNDETSDFSRAMAVGEESVESLARTAEEEVSAITESIGGRLKRLKETILIEIVEVGQLFLEMSMPIFEQVARIIKRFNDLDENTKKWILRLSALAAAFGGIIMVAGIFINLIGMTLKAVTGLLPVIKLMTEHELSMKAAWEAAAQSGGNLHVMMEVMEKQSKELARAREMEAQATLEAALANKEYMRIRSGPQATPHQNWHVQDYRRLEATKAEMATGFHQRGAPVKWRKGVAAAGMGAMGLAMIPNVGEGLSNQLMNFGILSSMSTMLPSTKAMKAFSEKMKDSAAHSKGLSKYLKKGLGSMTGLLGASPLVAVGIGAAGVAMFALYKHIERAKAEAAKLKNEFDVASDIAEELNLEVGQGKLSTAWGGQSVEEAEELSDAMKNIVDRVQAARGQQFGERRIEAMFRNLARQWLAGGATIDEINEKLNELEAVVGVSIDEVSLENLKETLTDDFSEALNEAMLNFEGDISIWRSIFIPGQRFSFDDEQAIKTSVNSLMGSIEAAIETEGGVDVVREMLGEFYTERARHVGDNEKALREFNRLTMDTMAERFNIPPEHAAELLSIDETLSYVYTRLASDKDMLIKMSEAERENLYELLEAYGQYTLYVRDATFTNEQFADSQYAVITTLNGLANELGLAVTETQRLQWDALGPLTSQFNTFDELLRHGTGRQIAETIGRLKSMRSSFSDNAAMVNYLDTSVRLLGNSLNAAFLTPFRPIGPLEARWLAMKERQAKEEADDNTPTPDTDAAESAGEDAAESYINGFRSELDRKRQEIIDDILEQYDEATDEIIDGLEKQRDAEVETLEERKDAIDEYIDKQDALQDALSKQLDLIFAIAGGDVDKAAQLQNEMMFQGVEETAEAERESLDEQIQGVEDTYDEKIDREEEYREEMRDTLEEQLELTEDIFIGTEEGWNEFLREVGRTAKEFDTAINTNLMNGWNDAIGAIVQDARLDSLWENADFSVLRDKLQPFLDDLKDGVRDAIGTGGTAGADDVVRAVDAYIQNYMDMLDAAGGAATAQDELHLIDLLTGQVDTNGGAVPSDFLDPEVPIEARHSGGAIGDGPAKDVPIMAQTGEYVIQRKAAQRLGKGTLDMLNSYHTGGLVGLGRLMGVMTAAPKLGAMMSGLGVTPDTRSVSPTSALQSPDADWTRGSSKYYGGWTYGLASGIVQKAATQLAMLGGGQAIVNAYRDAEHNRRVGGSPNSDHLRGKAIDIVNAGGATTPQWVDRVGSWFEGRSGVRWVGRPGTDPTGGHDDHAHISYYHGGGPVGLMKGGKVQYDNTLANLHRGELVLRRPLAESLERGIDKINRDGGGTENHFTFTIENFGGSPSDGKRFARDVEEILDKKYRKVNPTRRIS